MIDAWVSSFYRFVNQLGFTDPIHAALVHMPIGLVMGAFVFALVGILPGRGRLTLTARHCAILAFLFWFPTFLFGLADWLHFYRGAWLFPIKMKLILAGILFVLLLAALIFGSSEKAGPKKITLAVYTLSLVTVVLLGWYGARLVYAGQTGGGAAAYSGGEKIFETHCVSCHPGGGNVMDPDKPLKTSHRLKDFESFVAFIRHPEEPMPTFSPAQVSDGDAKELYRYITKVLVPSNPQK